VAKSTAWCRRLSDDDCCLFLVQEAQSTGKRPIVHALCQQIRPSVPATQTIGEMIMRPTALSARNSGPDRPPVAAQPKLYESLDPFLPCCASWAQRAIVACWACTTDCRQYLSRAQGGMAGNAFRLLRSHRASSESNPPCKTLPHAWDTAQDFPSGWLTRVRARHHAPLLAPMTRCHNCVCIAAPGEVRWLAR
jgi:hypothetical protein